MFERRHSLLQIGSKRERERDRVKGQKRRGRELVFGAK
jgi:hypothetical protein